MIRPVREIRSIAKKHGFKIAAIAQACDPELPYTTVWRILTGQREGRCTSIEAISQALDRLLEEQVAEREAST